MNKSIYTTVITALLFSGLISELSISTANAQVISRRNGGVISHPDRTQQDAPNSLSAGGNVTTAQTRNGYFHMRFTGDVGPVLFDHLKYGIEVFSRQPQSLRQMIVGKHLVCRTRGRHYYCESVLKVQTGEFLPLSISRLPIDTRETGRIDRRSQKTGKLRISYEPVLDMPHTFFTVIKGESSLALFKTLSKSNRVRRLPSGGMRVSNGYWICYKRISPLPNHCKSYIGVEDGAFKPIDRNGPTLRLFYPDYFGMTPEGAVIWN